MGCKNTQEQRRLPGPAKTSGRRSSQERTGACHAASTKNRHRKASDCPCATSNPSWGRPNCVKSLSKSKLGNEQRGQKKALANPCQPPTKRANQLNQSGASNISWCSRMGADGRSISSPSRHGLGLSGGIQPSAKDSAHEEYLNPMRSSFLATQNIQSRLLFAHIIQNDFQILTHTSIMGTLHSATDN